MLRPAYLTILDVAHRWHGLTVPRASRGTLPPVVRMTAAMLLQAIVDARLAVYESHAHHARKARRSGMEVFGLDEIEETPVALAAMHASGRFDPDVLAHYRLCVDEVYVWAVGEGFHPPAACQPSWANTPRAATRVRRPPRPEADHKRTCQTIAKHRWTLDDRIGVSEMARDTAIQMEGNGRLYRETTVRRWLAEVAPTALRTRSRSRSPAL